MDSKTVFRPVDENDFLMILELEKESFNRYDRLDLETLTELFTEFRDGFCMILLDDVIAGYSVFLIEGGEGYIESIAISKKYRRLGLGFDALRYMIDRMARLEIKKINLHVRFDNNAAMALYEKEGFTRKGIVEGFYTDGEPAYLYSASVSCIPRKSI